MSNFNKYAQNLPINMNPQHNNNNKMGSVYSFSRQCKLSGEEVDKLHQWVD